MNASKFQFAHAARRPAVMGVLNVTPDSFSDGGAFSEPRRAVEHALFMLDAGADLIDVGPESSRPGSKPVTASEQIERALPIIESILTKRPDAVISLDTRLAEVARAGIDAGVQIINDISALRDDADLASLIAERQVGIVLMHMQGSPESMQANPQYGDVVEEVATFLRNRAECAIAKGIPKRRIAFDPGIGFGKTLAHNLALLKRLDRIVDLGYPVLLGASRKRFIGMLDAQADSPDQRLGGSLACVARAFIAGATIVRVHDVFETRQLLDVLAAIAP